MSLVSHAPRAARSRLAALLAAAALAIAPAAVHAQTVTAWCSRSDAAGCTAVRVSLVAGGAPWILDAFSLYLSDGWSFASAPADASRTPFTGADSYTLDEPFTATAARPDARTALVDFGVSPGFDYELWPDAEGYLEFAVTGAGALDLAYSIADLDGVVTDGRAPITTTPEPATGALLAAGGALLAAVSRRRRARAEGR
jgi:hypothetical protein